MTNKQERYFVCSESELKQLSKAAAGQIAAYEMGDEEDARGADRKKVKAEAACRARPVPEWATHFCKLDYYKVGDQIQEAEEIKK